MPEVTAELIRNVLIRQQRHPNYNKTVEIAKPLIIHADGLYPEKLIDERRPNEGCYIKDYRKKIYEPITKRPVSKIITSLGKIRRSPDWSIQYDSTNIPKSISENETPESYCEFNYPGYTSITNWMFKEGLRRYLLDANSVVAVIPKEQPKSSKEFIKPVARIFNSIQVLDFVPDDYAILLSSETVPYSSPQGRNRYDDGRVCYVVTTQYVARYEQSTRSQDFRLAWSYAHGFGYMPAFKVGGEFLTDLNNDIIYQSRIADIIPSLNEAAREYSDLQAEIVQHIHSEKYIYTNTECPECNGVGHKVKDGDGDNEPENVTCKHCNGVGSIRSTSPYGEYLITQTRADENPLPIPPFGFIEKQTEIAKLQDERIRKHIYDALSAVNMEFLAETPLNQSGTAKEVDKDELNNLVGSIAEDIVAIMDNVYKFIIDYRYSYLIPNENTRALLRPTIPVPERFDLLNTSHIMSEVSAAKTAGVNGVLVRAMEVDYSRKKFNANPEVSDMLDTVYQLDPLPGLTEDEKMTRLSNGGITEISYIISSNIVPFVQRAVNEDATFYQKSLEDKQAIINTYAEEVKRLNSARADVTQLLSSLTQHNSQELEE